MTTILNPLSNTSHNVTIRALSEGLRGILAIAHKGRIEQLWAEIERYLTEALVVERVVVLVRAGGIWRPWDFATSAPDAEETFEILPFEAIGWKHVCFYQDNLYVPIMVGAVCVVVFQPNLDQDVLAILDFVATSLSASATACEKQMIAVQNLDGAQAVQRVATKILKSHDLSEIMQLITLEAKRLLSADICGIMLREGDEVVMKQCVGNFSIATASLRMKQGQGIAGQVFALKQPCRVEDYLESDEISRDFFSLAQDEKVRSALAAPLLSCDEIIGVLEVWRRIPSTFTELEATRLVVLANLVSLAIDNARLYTGKQQALQEIEKANKALSERYEIARNLVTLTEDLVNLLLGEQGLTAIAKRTAKHLCASVFITDRDLHVLAASSEELDLPATVLAARMTILGKNHEADEKAVSFGIGPGDERCVIQKIFVAKEFVGCIVVLPQRAIDDEINLAVVQVALVTALYNLEQRSASRARSETMDAVVWDMLQGSDNVRHAAIDRLRDMKVDLPSPLRVLLLVFENSGKQFAGPSLGLIDLEERRRVVGDAHASAEGSSFGQYVIGVRGDIFAILVSEASSKDIERSASKMVRRISEQLEGVNIFLGASAPSDTWNLPKALQEAKVSIDVARQRGRSGVVIYEKSGVVGLLFSIRHDMGIHNLIDSTFGRLMKEDDKKSQQLIDTLRVYFDLNCSQEAAAQRLGVHRKTISYRLEKISELTGLDFSTHEDRLLADLALYVKSAISRHDDI